MTSLSASLFYSFENYPQSASGVWLPKLRFCVAIISSYDFLWLRFLGIYLPRHWSFQMERSQVFPRNASKSWSPYLKQTVTLLLRLWPLLGWVQGFLFAYISALMLWLTCGSNVFCQILDLRPMHCNKTVTLTASLIVHKHQRRLLTLFEPAGSQGRPFFMYLQL